MNKDELNKLKKRILTVALTGTLMTLTGCSENNSNNLVSIEKNYDQDFLKENVKLYKSTELYFLFNNETYDVEEYVYRNLPWLGAVELYNLKTGQPILYGFGMWTYNAEYINYLMRNNYYICLADINDYLETYPVKEEYTIEEIKRIEPLLREKLEEMNNSKEKRK